MVRIVRAGLALIVGTVVSLSAGCEGGSRAVSPEVGAEMARESALAELGELLRLQRGTSGKPPAKLADLAKGETAFPIGFRKVKDGEIVLLYGAPIDEKASDKILAYEKQAPESGGYVLMQDCMTVKKMSPEQFQSAPKAPGKAGEKPK